MRKQSTASAVSQNQPLHAETRARTTSDWSRKVPFKTFDDLISNIRSFTRGVLYMLRLISLTGQNGVVKAKFWDKRKGRCVSSFNRKDIYRRGLRYTFSFR
jgi:hypothetical protein